jgi:hypothetical protein
LRGTVPGRQLATRSVLSQVSAGAAPRGGQALPVAGGRGPGCCGRQPAGWV